MGDEFNSNGGIIKFLLLIIFILVISLIVIVVNKNNEQKELENIVAVNNQEATNIQVEERNIKKSDSEIKVIPTSLEKIYNNSTWCGTFQLVWNDMLKEIAKNDTIENSGIQMVENLNQKSFLETDLSDDYYYKNYGPKTLKLKKEIEDGIYKKFKEKSDILDNISWDADTLNDPKDKDYTRYLFYAMLKRDFEFKNPFTVLEDGTFGTEENVKFFGVNAGTEEEVREQVEVLYYDSESYAVILNSKNGDQIVLVKNSKEETFNDIYENAMEKSKSYTGLNSLTELDTLKVPNLEFELIKEYDELKGLQFPSKKNITAVIEEALQTINFSLDNKGGTIKSEAVITTKTAAINGEERHFDFDDEFTIFLKESKKDKPYFAANISNIKLFQK